MGRPQNLGHVAVQKDPITRQHVTRQRTNDADCNSPADRARIWCAEPSTSYCGRNVSRWDYYCPTTATILDPLKPTCFQVSDQRSFLTFVRILPLQLTYIKSCPWSHTGTCCITWRNVTTFTMTLSSRLRHHTVLHSHLHRQWLTYRKHRERRGPKRDTYQNIYLSRK